MLSFFIYRSFKFIYKQAQFINVPQGINQRNNFFCTLVAKIRQVRLHPAVKNIANEVIDKAMRIVIIVIICSAPVASVARSFFVKHRHVIPLPVEKAA